jgi:ABC-type sugar transport system ATPase subunit
MDEPLTNLDLKLRVGGEQQACRHSARQAMIETARLTLR